MLFERPVVLPVVGEQSDDEMRIARDVVLRVRLRAEVVLDDWHGNAGNARTAVAVLRVAARVAHDASELVGSRVRHRDGILAGQSTARSSCSSTVR